MPPIPDDHLQMAFLRVVMGVQDLLVDCLEMKTAQRSGHYEMTTAQLLLLIASEHIFQKHGFGI